MTIILSYFNIITFLLLLGIRKSKPTVHVRQNSQMSEQR